MSKEDISFEKRRISIADELGRAVRPPMNQVEFDEKFAYKHPENEESQFIHHVKKYLGHYVYPFTSLNAFRVTVISFFPILSWLPAYSFKDDLLCDLVGGLTVGVMHIPQGIAYAALAKVDPVSGLYTSLFPPLLYMFFGQARHNSIGSFAVVSLMTGIAVERITQVTARTEFDVDFNNSTIPDATPMQVASALTFTVGMVQFLIGFVQLDFFTTYLSDQVVAGFTTGASLHVFISQLKDVFGLRRLPKRSGPGYLLMNLYDMAIRLPSTNFVCLTVSLCAMAILIVGKQHLNPLMKRTLKTDIPFPFEFLVIIGGTLVSYLLDFNRDYRVKIVKTIPTGFPVPALPHFSLVPSLLGEALSIAVVAVAVHISLAKMFAKKMNYNVEPSQELYALGLSSVGSSFMPVYPAACSLGRTLVNVGAGTKTQLSSISSAALLVCVILYFGKFLETLPMCVLSAIVIVALKGMLDKFADLRLLWPVSKIDFSIWIVSFLSTACIDVTEGLAISILYALFTTIMREQWPRWHLLGNVQGTADFRDSERYEDVYFFNGICIFRFDSPLLFTNVENFKKTSQKAFTAWEQSHEYYVLRVERSRILMNSQDDLKKTLEEADMLSRHFIVDCSGFTFVDYMGVSALKEMYSEMRNRNVQVYFAAAKAPVRELFESCGFYEFVAKEHFYPTIRDAVAIARIKQKSKGIPQERYHLEHDRLSEIISSHPMN